MYYELEEMCVSTEEQKVLSTFFQVSLHLNMVNYISLLICFHLDHNRNIFGLLSTCADFLSCPHLGLLSALLCFMPQEDSCYGMPYETVILAYFLLGPGNGKHWQNIGGR